MKLVKKIKEMFSQLPPQEKDIFKLMFGEIENISSHKHKQKQIIHNLLLWRTYTKDDLCNPK